MGSRGNYCRSAHPAAANDVGVDTAAANFGLLIVPRPITNRQQRTLCVRTRVSAMRATAAVTIGNRTGELRVFVVWISGAQIEVFICSAALRVMSTAELVIAQQSTISTAILHHK